MLAAASCGKRGATSTSLPANLVISANKGVCLPPQGDANIPWGVQAGSEAGQVGVGWRGKHIGDYDLDGTVGVADITPIAVNFGAAVEYVDGMPVESGENEYLACIDGDGNSTIGVSDITPIAQHFSERCTGYRVYLGLRATGEADITWQAAYQTPPGDPTSPVTVPFNTSQNAGEVQRYSFSFANPDGFEGFAKVRIAATDGANEGAMAESGEFALTAAAVDTAPPYHTGGITGLSAAAKPGRVILSWGTWEDAQSPPVDIEIAWGITPLDTNSPEHSTVVDASAQTYEVDSLTNDQAYEFSCRFLDQATPANATGWMPTVSATPSANLYSFPPIGAAVISPAAGLSPSVDACDGTETAVHDPYSPMVAYISAGGSNAGQLIFARYYNGAWLAETVSADTFSACSVIAAGDVPVIIAARLTPSPSLMRYWNDAELSGWNSEAIYNGATSNLNTYRAGGDLLHPYVAFTIGNVPNILVKLAHYDSSWNISTYSSTFTDSIIDISMTQRPADALKVLITHGTVDAVQAQISSTIACLSWETAGQTWSLEGDYPLPNDAGNSRSAFSADFWPTLAPNFLGVASAIRIVPTNIPFVGWVDVPYSDVLGMVPGGFGAQQDWVVIKKGATTPRLMPLGLILDWYIEPRWTKGDDTVVFVKVAGTLDISITPSFTITGGSLTPTWYASTRSGSGWSIPQALGAYVPSGRGHDLAQSDTANGFQMVYAQVDTIDVDSLLGGGALPTGNIYYARK